ncbi:MAG: beta-lactamase family protein [Parvibaculum sp.]|uniref:serine hydrolase domain-containing protein n=1 Tax=Parvibaculum sp. TaxID=2024848 RepID=UPI0025FEABD6|nr:serine hydrolase domain-containing protein [Parvibaculum sp.]MCE9649088.1 beta-lactamase family protein [Parvibaculum sp.]
MRDTFGYGRYSICTEENWIRESYRIASDLVARNRMAMRVTAMTGRRMRRLAGTILFAAVLLVVWTAIVGGGAREGWWRAMPAAKGDTAGFLRWAEARYAAESQGNIAIVLLDRGHVAETFYASHGRPVDSKSLFQVASMSKWITAWGVMALVEQHRIDLDAPVSRYLTRWHLPPSEFDNNAVTVRRLLAHTAGLTDGLGFRGFEPGQTLPSVEQELTRATDTLPGANGITQVGASPGTSWRYSGGGYLLLQLLVEEVTHEPFNDAMHRLVFQPLEMKASTFVDPDPAHLVDFYDAGGSKAVHYKFAALAAASLYTSAEDMTRFIAAQFPGENGAPPGRGVLSPAMLETMRRPQAFLFGIPVWGLGETLYVPNGAGSYVVGHDGNNYPAINTTARIDPATGDGILVLETGNATLAREIGGEWTYWQTGVVGLDTLVMFDLHRILIILASGAFAILIGSFAWHRRRR